MTVADAAKVVEYAKDFFLQRVLVYGLIVLSSVFVIAPLGVLHTHFNGQCLLYSDVTYLLGDISGNTTVFFKILFGSKSICQYNISLAAIFSLFYALALSGGYLFLYFREKGLGEKSENKIDLAHVAFLVHCVLEVVISVFMLISACTISAGFRHLCSSITAETGIDKYRVNSCTDAQNFHDWRGYDGSNFHVCLSVATVGSWFQFIFWVLQAIFGMWKIWRLNMFPSLPSRINCPSRSG